MTDPIQALVERIREEEEDGPCGWPCFALTDAECCALLREKFKAVRDATLLDAEDVDRERWLTWNGDWIPGIDGGTDGE